MSKQSASALLKELIAIPSVNPTGDPGCDADKVGEGRLARYLADRLREAGAMVQLIAVEPDRPNLLATFEPDQPVERHIAFLPHLDTVSVQGMTIPPFEPKERNGRIYGRGASDTKGPMAAILAALFAYLETDARARSTTRVTFGATMGEEAGTQGALALARSGFKPDLVLVQEPTEMKVVTAHKGALWLKLTTEGIARHASNPTSTDNAIYRMARAIQVLRDEVIPRVEKVTHGLLGHATLAATLINGGSKVNIIPDSCHLECDCRTVPGLNGEVLSTWIREAFEKRGALATVGDVVENDPLNVDRELPLIAAAGDAFDGFTVAPWFCDAAPLAAVGIPAVAVGPGSITQAHTKDEWIDVAALEAGATQFLAYLKSLG